MCVTRLLSLILVFIVDVNAEALSCPPSTSLTTHARLKNSILCNYDPTIRPVVNHRNVTVLNFKFFLKYFTYDITKSTLGFDAWMHVNWMDQHLTWNPDDYESINSIILDTNEIWMPDLSIYERAVQGGDPTIIGDTKCSISNKGQVKCIPSIHIDALCVPDLRMYPFDTQLCPLRIGPWNHKAEELDIQLSEAMIYFYTMEQNGEWKITYTQRKIKVLYENGTKGYVEIILNVKRLAGAHVASVIIPTIVAFMLTITILCMSPMNNDRLILCFVNLVVQFTHVQYLSWQIPLKGAQIPNLFLIARDSLLLSAFVVVFTIGFKNLMKLDSPPPEWIRSMSAIAVATPPGQFILLADYSARGVGAAKGEEDSDEIFNPEKKKTEDWMILVKILDILLLGAYSIVYLTMALKFMP